METISKTIEIDGVIEDVEIDVNILRYMHIPSWQGNIYDCPSDEDYYGFTELTYEIVDTFKLTDLGEREKIALNITPELEGAIYDELLIMAVNYREEEEVYDLPLAYVSY